MTDDPTADPMGDPTDDSMGDAEAAALLSELRQAIHALDPPPADLADRARRSFEWDASLAVLVETESAGSAPLRSASSTASAPGSRDLEYRLDSVHLRLTVAPEGDGRFRLIGDTDPAPTVVRLQEPSGRSVEFEADHRGRFTTVSWAAAVALILEFEDGTSVRTPVFDLTADEPGSADNDRS